MKQGGVCAGCKTGLSQLPSKKICVDHCHAYGHVRGILCDDCNLILGFAQDDPKTLSALATYLKLDAYKMEQDPK